MNQLILRFQMFCGTDPLPELFRAKRYKIKQKFLTKSEFYFIMKNLPVEVSDDDIEDMFTVADTDNDGKLGYQVHIVNPNRNSKRLVILFSLFYCRSFK